MVVSKVELGVGVLTEDLGSRKLLLAKEEGVLAEDILAEVAGQILSFDDLNDEVYPLANQVRGVIWYFFFRDFRLTVLINWDYVDL